MNVPASMRSAMMAWSNGSSSSAPWTRMIEVPAPYARPHLVQHAAELLHLRLARGVDQRGAALGESSRHHQILGAGDGRHVEHDLGTLQATAALGNDEAVGDLDARAERLETEQMLVDRPRADRAAAG
jgi:hypothetical protein